MFRRRLATLGRSLAKFGRSTGGTFNTWEDVSKIQEELGRNVQENDSKVLIERDDVIKVTKTKLTN